MNTDSWVLQLLAVSGVQLFSPKLLSAERICSPEISIQRQTPPSSASDPAQGQPVLPPADPGQLQPRHRPDRWRGGPGGRHRHRGHAVTSAAPAGASWRGPLARGPAEIGQGRLLQARLMFPPAVRQRTVRSAGSDQHPGLVSVLRDVHYLQPARQLRAFRGWAGQHPVPGQQLSTFPASWRRPRDKTIR